MVYVYVWDIMDVVFSVCIVLRGACSFIHYTGIFHQLLHI